MIKTIHKLEEIVDFAWELSNDNNYASYPRNKSITHVKKNIEHAISRDNNEVIAYYHKNVLYGICTYFWIEDVKYAQTTHFLIREIYDQTAEEILGYISKQLPGYELLIGVPSTNKNAIEYFNKKNIGYISSTDTRMYNLKPHINHNHNFIEEINENNFEDYALFHDKYAIPLEMYYNSKNLKNDIDRFRIFVFKKDEIIHGSIFAKTSKNISEIFGLFVDKEFENRGIESILIDEMLMQLYNEFGSVDEVVYFIDGECIEELNSALDAGFEIKDNYICYKYIL